MVLSISTVAGGSDAFPGVFGRWNPRIPGIRIIESIWVQQGESDLPANACCWFGSKVSRILGLVTTRRYGVRYS
jgi:hypothetical protein